MIALSGLGQEEYERRAVEAGFDVHFTKPVDIQTLNKLLARTAMYRPRSSKAGLAIHPGSLTGLSFSLPCVHFTSGSVGVSKNARHG